MNAQKKKMMVLLIIILTILSVSPASAATTLTDDVGTTITITSPPQRIVSLSPSNTEILFALGLGDRVVGVTEYCNYPAEALEKPTVGGYSTVSIEKVIAIKPDLILASYGNGEDLVENLCSLGYTVVALNPETLDQVIHDIRLVGKTTGADENATVLADGLQERIDTVEARVAGVQERPSVAHVIWNDPIFVSGSGTIQDELIRTAGGTNAFSGVEGWKNIGIEDFIQANPDVLIVNAGTGMGGGEDAIAQFFINEPRFSRVSAIRDNRVCIIDSNIVDRSSPRIVDALEIISLAIHPSRFANDTQVVTTLPEVQGHGFGTLVAILACAGGVLIIMRRNR